MAATLPSYLSIGGLILTGQEASGVSWVMQDFTGWGAVGGTLAAQQKVRAAGAWAGTSYETARTLTFAGTTYAPTAQLAQDAIDRLNAAVTLASTSLAVTESGFTRTMNVRRDGQIIVAWISALAFTWSVQVLALDFRKFAAPVSGSTFLPSSTGGMTWPETWPETWTATTVSGQVSLTNPGNTTGSVILRIDGPATGPSISHVGTAAPITFSSSLILGVGEWLTINMDAHQVLANDQSNRAQYITSAGWSGFDPGINTWSLAAAVFNAGTKLTVTATGAWQ